MFITDFRGQFYNKIRSQHVLVLSNCDVDALCACKILEYIFLHDQTPYTVVPLPSISDLIRSVVEYCGQIKHFVLVNCGGAESLVETLQPPEDTVFYVIDSRRPFHIDNVYSASQVNLLLKAEEIPQLNCPDFNDIYDESSEDEDENAESSDSADDILSSPVRKRKRKRDRPTWERKRNELLFNYYEFSYYSSSSAALLFNLVHMLSMDTNDTLWWSIVGLTSQMLESKINSSQYTLECVDINRKHLIRLNRSISEQFESSKDCIMISYENDLLLYLYRHWTLFESLQNTFLTACHFKTWTSRGIHKLMNFLVDVGLPLAQCRQKFTSMESSLRKGVKESIEEKAEKYRLNELLQAVFVARYTYCHKFSACDVAFSAAALLHFNNKAGVEQSFLRSLDALSRKHTNVLYKGVDSFKAFLKVALSEVCTYLNSGSVIPNNVILQCVISQETPGWKYFAKPYGIAIFGNFLLRAFVQTPKGSKHRNKPLVLAVSLRNEENTSLVVGVPPVYVQMTGEKPTNIMGQAFQRVAERTHCRMRQCCFDSSVVELSSEDKDRFLTALIATLEI